MERWPDEGVDGLRRINPTVVAAIALGALVLLIAAMMVLGNRSSEDDRLTGDEVTASSADPADRCSSKATYDELKSELFRRAAAARGGEEAAFGEIASHGDAQRFVRPVPGEHLRR